MAVIVRSFACRSFFSRRAFFFVLSQCSICPTASFYFPPNSLNMRGSMRQRRRPATIYGTRQKNSSFASISIRENDERRAKKDIRRKKVNQTIVNSVKFKYSKALKRFSSVSNFHRRRNEVSGVRSCIVCSSQCEKKTRI